MDDAYVSAFQIGLPGQVRKPLRGRNQRQGRHAGDILAFQAQQARRIVHAALRKSAIDRTAPAIRLPLPAPDPVEMRAVPRQRPAVVQRPDHGNPLPAQIAEEHGEIDIPAQQAMDMDRIDPETLHLPDQAPGRQPEEQVLAAGPLRQDHPDVPLHPRADPVRIRDLALQVTPRRRVADQDAVARCAQVRAYVQHDLPGGTIIIEVDLDDVHSRAI